MADLKDLFPEDNFEREMQDKLRELAPSIIDTLYERLADDGSTNAGKVLLNKIVSDAREPMPRLNLAPIEGLDDVPRFISELLSAAANGQITPSQVSKLINSVSTYVALQEKANSRAIGKMIREGKIPGM
ncbi:hypothetical protein [Desulfofustis glycolicus]|uniref:Uncharacterized protein n=1 Tax=Desulfofustis glycolicus DSM 9705 TaxID=1121409 RepID=A0A1M5YCV1_9BACT|nr:hypothetical protein [Desulfofustis glycolicus]SHI09901.1 hypothetical protein SAMN02745124_03889 [Desulfofustis glycolicus DSM 9705]